MDNGFSDYLGVFMCIFVTAMIIFAFAFLLQWNPLTPAAEVYGTNTTDTITVSGKIFDANNNWYEIITTDNVKYLTEPRNLSEYAEVNQTYDVVIEKKQLKLNLMRGSWYNTTYITSLKEVE